MPPNKMILFINGIDNKFEDFQRSLHHLSEISGGYNVQGVFCPTFGKSLDAFCYWHTLHHGAAYEGTRELQKNLWEFHERSEPGATALIIPHSRGVGYTRNGLMDSPPEIQDRADVRAFAPGAYTQQNICKSIRHYASTRDIVPMIDFIGRQRCKDSIVELQPHPQAPLFDHEFVSKTYMKSLELETKEYIRK